MESQDDKKADIVAAYLQIATDKRMRPTYSTFIDYDVTRDAIRSRFGGIEKLHQYVDENHSDEINKSFLTVGQAFADTRSAENSTKKVYIITTAVADSAPNLEFLKALDTYSAAHDAQIVIMPCESTTNSFENETAVFASVFHDPKYMFVTKDTPLNDNICLCSIQVSAKQIRPITGLSRIGNREGSFVFASTKQFLEFVPSGNKRGTNYSIMTTGACTLPQYYTNNFVSKRLSYIAERDHLIGAIIVEIQDDRIFHFRQVQAAPDGSFIDMGVQYNPDGSEETVSTSIVLGDLHGANIDKNALAQFAQAFDRLDVDSIYLHDVFDGYSVNHHVKTIAERATRADAGESMLQAELLITFNVIQAIEQALVPNRVVIVKSNHDEFLTRYLAEGRYVDDPENHYLSLKIATALFEDIDVLKHGFQCAGADVPERWEFLSRESSDRIGNVECGSHGDLGLNGAQASLPTLERIYGNCVVGHAHTAAIHRGVFRVGTLSKLDLKYNRGPSSWTQTCCLVYANGQRQLINLIDGKCSIFS